MNYAYQPNQAVDHSNLPHLTFRISYTTPIAKDEEKEIVFDLRECESVKQTLPINSAQSDLLRQMELTIDGLATREDDWDEGGPPPVIQECVERALEFVCLLYGETREQGAVWTPPEIDVAMDGGVQFYWYTTTKQTSLTFRRGKKSVEVQTTARKESSQLGYFALDEAMAYALLAFRNE